MGTDVLGCSSSLKRKTERLRAKSGSVFSCRGSRGQKDCNVLVARFTQTFGGGMRFSQKSLMVLSALVLAFLMVPASRAQVNSNVATVNLNAPLAESVTVVAGPGTVNFTLAPNGPATGSAPV